MIYKQDIARLAKEHKAVAWLLMERNNSENRARKAEAEVRALRAYLQEVSDRVSYILYADEEEEEID